MPGKYGLRASGAYDAERLKRLRTVGGRSSGHDPRWPVYGLRVTSALPAISAPRSGNEANSGRACAQA